MVSWHCQPHHWHLVILILSLPPILPFYHLITTLLSSRIHRLVMVVHTCNLNIWEAETERSWVWGQPGLHLKTLSQKKIKKKRICSRVPFWACIVMDLTSRFPKKPIALSVSRAEARMGGASLAHAFPHSWQLSGADFCPAVRLVWFLPWLFFI
jgi:hypothetical protein